jgi:hypothetical protein
MSASGEWSRSGDLPIFFERLRRGPVLAPGAPCTAAQRAVGAEASIPQRPDPLRHGGQRLIVSRELGRREPARLEMLRTSFYLRRELSRLGLASCSQNLPLMRAGALTSFLTHLLSSPRCRNHARGLLRLEQSETPDAARLLAPNREPVSHVLNGPKYLG